MENIQTGDYIRLTSKTLPGYIEEGRVKFILRIPQGLQGDLIYLEGTSNPKYTGNYIIEKIEEAMTKFSDLRKGDWVHVKSVNSGLALSGTILDVMRGTNLYGRFNPTFGGPVMGIRFEGQPSIVQTDDVYRIIEHRPAHKYPEVGKAIKMWNGKTPSMAKLTKGVGYWDGQKYLGHKFDESVGRNVEICWDSAVCSGKTMESIEWEYIDD